MPRRGPPRPTRIASALVAVVVAGCGGTGDGAGGVRVPSSAGDVWEIDHADDRAGAPAALLAYVNGVHLMVLDGDVAFAGMTRLAPLSRSGGGRFLRLSPSLEADLTPTPEGMELRFSTGETVPMRKRLPETAAP